ncbi:LCP family protein [Thermasporomyces composti]|jgi:LCP family protein required for cell wall assembly|uniref:LytR family transcriptional attenuator n=1 Tax=Thermasporomyces composti TaxID=696763 RepID=A0A3D9V872_THECX|nr:LCP family protein [Thermasporomyces composti]REF37496.1 LytR family transcriptional attenuator [Thermasporomyces composti]
MPNRGYPHDPDGSPHRGDDQSYEWLYGEVDQPRRPSGRRARQAYSPDEEATRALPTVGGSPYGHGPAGATRGHYAAGDRYAATDWDDGYASRSYGNTPYTSTRDPYARGSYRDPYASRHDPYAGDDDPYGRTYPHDTVRLRDGAGAPTRPSGPRSPVRPSRPAPRLPRRRRGIPWFRVLTLLVLTYLVVLVAVPILAWNRVDKVPFAPTGDRPADSSGTNYLLVGSDSREGLTPEERVRLGTGSAGGRRTDTIMLLHVPSFGGPPVLISIPRDSYVPIPGRGRNKINAAFAYGGPQLLTETVENVTGLRVDGYIEIGFGGFVEVVDSLGGVEMCLPKPVKDEKAHIDLPAGCQDLDGPNALGYVRARYFDPKGDLGRVERQRQFLSAVMAKTLSPSTILNPIRYTSVGLATGDALTVGEDTGIVDAARFALAMRTISSGKGVTLTVPIENPAYRTPVGSAVKWDSSKALALFRALRDGNPVPPSLLPEDDQ